MEETVKFIPCQKGVIENLMFVCIEEHTLHFQHFAGIGAVQRLVVLPRLAPGEHLADQVGREGVSGKLMGLVQLRHHIQLLDNALIVKLYRGNIANDPLDRIGWMVLVQKYKVVPLGPILAASYLALGTFQQFQETETVLFACRFGGLLECFVSRKLFIFHEFLDHLTSDAVA